MDNSDITRQLKARALDLGFDDCGIADPSLESDDGLDAWLAQGKHNGLQWLEKSRDKRQHIDLVLPGVRSVIVTASNYYHPGSKAQYGHARIARYAWRRDYHRVILPRLKCLAAWIEHTLPGTKCYCSTDTGPVRERPWAARAGLGWIGRNSLLIHPIYGSWMHLGIILCTAELVPDKPMPDHCGSCKRCLIFCPTDAIEPGRVIDTRKCIACQTIESRSCETTLPSHNWVFGCDLCQEACPVNLQLQREDTTLEAPRQSFANLTLEELSSISEEEYLTYFAGTPIMRAGHAAMQRFARHALTALPQTEGTLQQKKEGAISTETAPFFSKRLRIDLKRV